MHKHKYIHIHKEVPVFKFCISSKMHTNKPEMMLNIISGNISSMLPLICNLKIIDGITAPGALCIP